MSDPCQVLLGNCLQGAPLRDDLDQHILDSLTDPVKTILLLSQTQKAKEKISPLAK